MFVDKDVSATCVHLSWIGIGAQSIFLVLFLLDYVRNCRLHSIHRQYQSFRALWIICIVSQMLSIVEFLWPHSIARDPTLRYSLRSVLTVYNVAVPVILPFIMLKTYGQYRNLKSNRLPCPFVFVLTVYTFTFIVANFLFTFPIDDRIPSQVYSYCLYTFTVIQAVALCFLMVFFCKIRNTGFKTYKYQSMFLADKTALYSQKRSIEMRLCQWMFLLAMVMLYDAVSITAYIWMAVESREVFMKSEQYLVLMQLVGHTVLNVVIFYFLRSHDGGCGPESMSGSVIGAEDDNIDEGDFYDSETEYSLTASATSTIINSRRINHAFTQIIYYEDEQ